MGDEWTLQCGATHGSGAPGIGSQARSDRTMKGWQTPVDILGDYNQRDSRVIPDSALRNHT